MKKVLALASLFLMFAVKSYAGDTVCAGANCVGVNQVSFTTNTDITINSITFPDATSINSANGLGGAGSAASLVLRMGNSFVTITTAIAGGDLVFQTKSGTGVFKVDLSSYAKVTDTTTLSGLYTYSSHIIFSSAAKFNAPAANAPALIIDGVSNRGILKAGSTASGAGGETQYFTGSSSQNFRTGYELQGNYPGFYIATPSTKAFTITPDGRVKIGLTDQSGYASAMLDISSAAGSSGILLMCSTGNTNLFQVSSNAGVSISSLQVSAIMLPAHLAATNAPTDQYVPKYDAATGKWTWSADNNSGGGGGGGGSIAVFTNNNVNTGVVMTTFGVIVANGLGASYSGSSITLSIPSTATITMTSATINQGLTVNSVTATWMSVNGAGAGIIANTNGQIGFDSNNDGTQDFQINNSSISMGSGDFIALRDKDRFTTPHFGSGTFVTYIATPTMGIASSTLGAFQFSNAISSQANFCVYPWVVPDDIDLTANVVLSSFGIVLGGDDTGGQVYQISVATNQAGSLALETKFSGSGAWQSSATVVIAGDAAGASGDLETSTGAIVLGGWQNVLIPGQIHYIIVSRDGDHGSDSSTVNSYSSFFTISYRRRFYQ